MFEYGLRIRFVNSSFELEECVQSPLTVAIDDIAKVGSYFVLFVRAKTPAELRTDTINAIADAFPEEGFAELVVSFEPPVK